MDEDGSPTTVAPHRRPYVVSAIVLATWLTAVVAPASLLSGPDAAPGSGAVGVLLAAGLLLPAVAAAVRPRLADRVLAALVGLLLVPVLLAVGLAVRLTSRGPVLVRTGGIDGEGRRLPVLRFRTTVATDPASTTPEGDRPTPVGRVLRRLCLDELPRLLDVARGGAALLRSGRR